MVVAVVLVVGRDTIGDADGGGDARKTVGVESPSRYGVEFVVGFSAPGLRHIDQNPASLPCQVQSPKDVE